jgi:hypothetical protein
MPVSGFPKNFRLRIPKEKDILLYVLPQGELLTQDLLAFHYHYNRRNWHFVGVINGIPSYLLNSHNT